MFALEALRCAVLAISRHSSDEEDPAWAGLSNTGNQALARELARLKESVKSVTRFVRESTDVEFKPVVMAAEWVFQRWEEEVVIPLLGGEPSVCVLFRPPKCEFVTPIRVVFELTLFTDLWTDFAAAVNAVAHCPSLWTTECCMRLVFAQANEEPLAENLWRKLTEMPPYPSSVNRTTYMAGVPWTDSCRHALRTFLEPDATPVVIQGGVFGDAVV